MHHLNFNSMCRKLPNRSAFAGDNQGFFWIWFNARGHFTGNVHPYSPDVVRPKSAFGFAATTLLVIIGIYMQGFWVIYVSSYLLPNDNPNPLRFTLIFYGPYPITSLLVILHNLINKRKQVEDKVLLLGEVPQV